MTSRAPTERKRRGAEYQAGNGDCDYAFAGDAMLSFILHERLLSIGQSRGGEGSFNARMYITAGRRPPYTMHGSSKSFLGLCNLRINTKAVATAAHMLHFSHEAQLVEVC